MVAPCLLMLVLQAGTATARPLDARALVEKLEARQKSVGDITARFTQTYRSGALGKEVVERGELRMKRPGRMRWDYSAPDKKLFVADGNTFYFFVPADRQVVVSEQDGRHSVAAILLAERSGILDEFDAALADGAPAGLVRLRLNPRKGGGEVDHVLVDLDPSPRIRSIHVKDAQGNTSRFDLHDVRENTGLSDRLFRFDIPAGVEVIEG